MTQFLAQLTFYYESNGAKFQMPIFGFRLRCLQCDIGEYLQFDGYFDYTKNSPSLTMKNCRTVQKYSNKDKDLLWYSCSPAVRIFPKVGFHTLNLK